MPNPIPRYARPFLLLLPLGLGGSPGVSAASPPAAGPPSGDVRLTFAWPDGAEAEVSYELRARRQRGTSSSTITRLTRYRLAVTRSGERTLIERHWPESKPSEPNPAPAWIAATEGELQALIDDLPEKVPRWIATADGRLDEIGGAQEVLAAAVHAAQSAKQLSPATRLAALTLFTPEAQLDVSRQSFSALVGIWAGRRLVSDLPYRTRTEGPVPGHAGSVDLEGKGSFLGWVPCTPDAEEARCVQLRWQADPMDDDVKDALAQLGQRDVAAISMTREVTLVTEPATLLPHRTEDVLKASGTAHGPSGPVETDEEIVRTRSFRWLKR